MNKLNDLNNQITQLDELIKKACKYIDEKDFTNPDFKAAYCELLKKCKPVFTTILDNALELAANIERKNQLLDDILADDDYDLYDEKKAEYSDITGHNIEDSLSLLERYFNFVDSCMNILRQNDCFFGHEYFMHSEKLRRFAFVISEVEKISYMR